jgi:lipopolysaccharide transport system ATP-binding protein
VLRGGPPVFAKIKVHDRQGDIAFNAMDTAPQWEGHYSPGVYVSTAWIPGHLLNEGTTSIDVAVCTLAAPKLLQRGAWYDAVSFYVVDPGDGDTARGRFTGQLRGVVRPLLEWTTEKL